VKNAALLTLILLLGIAVVLARTNPTTQQYQAFLESSLTRTLERMGEDNRQETSREKHMIRELIRSQGRKVIESVTRSNTIRHNYGLFSVYETTALGVRVRVLGIGTQFVPLEDEEAIVKKLGQLIL
jgi:hypothetical protein